MTEEVRGLDIPALSDWLTQNIDGVSAPFSFRILAGGHSNLTYQVSDANGRRFALRRPPLGTVSARAHDMSREYKIYSALQGTAVPVPGTVVMCEDTQVIGAPFYLMDFVAGAVIDSPEEVQNHLPDPAQRREAAFSLIDTLATMHRLDVDRIGLGDLGRRENYLERQLKRFKGIWDKTKTRDLDAIDRQYEQLMDLQPEQRYTGIVHSDYRLGNVMLDEHGRVAAVLDWELCALGDVLVDVGFLIDNWDDNRDPAPGVWMQAAPTRAGGFPTQQELIDRYAERSGFDVSDLDYYRAFCYWRIAIIGEGIKRRYQSAALGSQISPEFVEERIRQRVVATEHFLGRALAQ